MLRRWRRWAVVIKYLRRRDCLRKLRGGCFRLAYDFLQPLRDERFLPVLRSLILHFVVVIASILKISISLCFFLLFRLKCEIKDYYSVYPPHSTQPSHNNYYHYHYCYYKSNPWPFQYIALKNIVKRTHIETCQPRAFFSSTSRFGVYTSTHLTWQAQKLSGGGSCGGLGWISWVATL